MNEKQYAITVTSGLLDSLDDTEIESVLGHELTHIRNGDVRMMVVAVIIAGVVSFVAELVFRLWIYGGLRGSRSSDDRRSGGAGLAILIGIGLHRRRLHSVLHHPAGAVAVARIPRGCRLGGTHQKSRRDDLGASQDRRARRAARCDLGGDGNVHRQSAPGFWRTVRYASVGGPPGRGAGRNSPEATIPDRSRCRLRVNRPSTTSRPLPDPGARPRRTQATHRERARPKQPVRPMPGPPDRGARAEAVGSTASPLTISTGKHAAGVAKARANILTLSNPEPGVVEP